MLTTPLADEETASCAEILAAALQAHGRATVVGTRTAGAVSKKLFVSLPGGALLSVRAARILSPRGLDLGLGATPDVGEDLSVAELDRGVDGRRRKREHNRPAGLPDPMIGHRAGRGRVRREGP